MEPKVYKVNDVLIIFDEICSHCRAIRPNLELPLSDIGVYVKYKNMPICETCGGELNMVGVKCLRTNHSDYSEETLKAMAEKILDKLSIDMNDILYDAILDDLYYNKDIPGMMVHFARREL